MRGISSNRTPGIRRRRGPMEVIGLARSDQVVTVIGDAAKPGKSKAAIASAFEAALLDQ